MVTEEEKFKAETLRIFGIALITPFARFILDPYLFLREHDPLFSICYIVFAIVSGIIGVIQIEYARSILEEKGIDKWKQKLRQ